LPPVLSKYPRCIYIREGRLRVDIDPSVTSALAREASRIEEGALYYEHSHRLAAGRWRLVNAVVGGTAAILSGIAAGLTGAEVGAIWVPVLLAALGGSFAAALTFFKPGERASQHEQAQVGFNLLRGDLRRFRTIDALVSTEKELSRRLDSLVERRAALVASGPHYSQALFEKARQDIKAGVFQYAVDEETAASSEALAAPGASRSSS
jgi:hypothetical protein